MPMGTVLQLRVRIAGHAPFQQLGSIHSLVGDVLFVMFLFPFTNSLVFWGVEVGDVLVDSWEFVNLPFLRKMGLKINLCLWGEGQMIGLGICLR